MRQPELSVVVASHDRPLRLRWLLNSLEQQTLDRALWEVVVCHDSRGPETDELLEAHGLTADGTLRWTSLPAGTAPPGANRNAALALACAPVLVFTDDDCRPPPKWLEHVRGAVQRHPGSIIQGPVAGDPDEQAMRRAPRPRTQAIELVPTPWAECCNIVYPRALVERVGGFDPHAVSCEDTDLARRALAAGADYDGDPSMLTFHAIEDATIRDWTRASAKWSEVPWLLARHPELRGELYLRLFWKHEHFWLLVALWAGLRAVRRPWWALLAAPWALRRGSHGQGIRGRLRDLLELPGWAVIDAAEIVALVRGSIRESVVVL